MIKPSLDSAKKQFGKVEFQDGFGMDIGNSMYAQRLRPRVVVNTLNLNSAATTTYSLHKSLRLIDLVFFPSCPDSPLQY